MDARVKPGHDFERYLEATARQNARKAKLKRVRAYSALSRFSFALFSRQ